MLLRNPPSPMRIAIDLGTFFEISSMRPLLCVKAQPQGSTNFDSRINCSPWTVPSKYLCLSLFRWAKFPRTKGAVKLHFLLDHDGYLPTYAHISEGKRHDVAIARKVSLAPGSIVVIDRGYNDYKLCAHWTCNGIFLVTRLKENADYRVVENRFVPHHRNIVSDQLIPFTGFYAPKTCPSILRRAVVWDQEKEQEIVLLTNYRDFGSTTISAIYRDRWQIELFFTALKQNLKVKTFAGATRNALYIQIWTALIAMLLIKYAQFRSNFGWSLSNLVASLR